MKLLTLLLTIFITVLTAKAQYVGKITSVYDGETVFVELHNGDIDSIKLWGIDAPELDQEYGVAAKRRLAKYIHQDVSIKYKTRDRQNYMVAIISYKNGSDEEVILNNALVEEGYAWKNKYCDDKDLEKLQKKAEKDKKGLWKNNNPIAPWDWRENNQ